jgi:spermidine synthase
LLALFFLSGISGLLYEVVWTRMLHLLFGDTVLAVSTVLASFMAGLALGSFWSGRYADRRPRVLTLYAGLELGIGLSALLLPVALDALAPAYIWMHRALAGSPLVFGAARFLLALCLLGVPTALMGATLPVLSRYIARNDATLGWSVGTLYALNTAGAVVGCFTAGFALIGWVGLSATVWIGAALNLAIGLVVWAGQRWVGEEAAPVGSGVGTTGEAPPLAADRSTVRRVLWSFGLAGCVALSYEVIWTRALTFFIGNSTYAFTAMLTTFLCGLALGAAVFARWSDRPGNALPRLGALQVMIGVYGMLTIAILGHLFYGVSAWWERFGDAGWGAPLWLTFLKTFLVILPPTICMGGIFPLASRIAAAGASAHVGDGVGRAYACNTLGAIAGSLLSGFAAIPLLGTHASLALASLLSVAVGGALLASGSRGRLRQGLVYAGALGLLLGAGIATPRLRFADIAGEPEKEILSYDEGVAGIVKVATDIYDRKLLSINGWSVAGTGTPNVDIALVNDYPEVQKMLAHLPMLLHPAPRRALAIGFGAGGTAWSFTRYAALQQFDLVEFVPGVIRAARFFPEVNHGVLSDPRLRIIIDDGRNYLLVTPQTYDVISVDTLDPKHAGNGNLYTREFYELSRRALRPGGIFVQWLPYHQVDNLSLKMIARTFLGVYPDATLWLNRFKGYTLLLGTLEPLRIDMARLVAHFRTPAIQRDLAEVHVATPWQFLESFAMRPDTLRRYAAGSAGQNSYDHPYVEFYGASWRDPVAENLGELSRFTDDVAPLLVFANGAPEELERARAQLALHRRISRHIFRGYLASWRRDLQAGTREYRKALKLDPDDEGVKFALGIGAASRRQAMSALERAPDDIKSLDKLGYIAWNERDYAEAIRRFQQVVALDPRRAAAFVHLGVNYAAQERFDASIAAYREAARLRPDLAGLVEQSIELVEGLRRAKDHPSDAAAQAHLGDLYAGDGRSDRAIDCFERAAALDPSSPKHFFALARQYEAEELDDDAQRAYGRVLALEPGNAAARNNYEKLAIKTAIAGGTRMVLALGGGQDIAIDPDDGASYYQLGLRYLQSGEADSAVFALRRAIALAPNDDGSQLFLGLAHTALGAHADAEVAFRRAIALRPANPRAYNYLGLAYHRQRRYAEAIAAYRQAIAQAPDYALAYANLAASQEAIGEIGPALAAYREALQRDAALQAVQERIDALGSRLTH